MKRYLTGLGLMLLCLTGTSSTTQAAPAECEGNFVNPITDAYWECIFPVIIDSVLVVKGRQSNTSNPSVPIQFRPTGILHRVRLAVDYRELMALTGVTRSPYHMVNLGGLNISIGNVGSGAGERENRANPDAFYHARWYKYPFTYWFNIVTLVGCLQGGDLDIGYLSGLDPTRDNSSPSMIIQPEAILFDNTIAQGVCVADAVASLVGRPVDALFWCADSQDSMYPSNGYVSNELSPLQASLLLSRRMAFKLHRQGVVMNSIGENTAMCLGCPFPIIPRSCWRHHLANKYLNTDQCHPLGRSVTRWEAGRNIPNGRRNFGYPFWRKRNCTFL